MPSTLSGLLLFIVALLPGFVYLVGRERVGLERRTSPFRETTAVLAASVATELAAAIVLSPLWAWSLDVDRLVREPERYWREEYGLISGWVLGWLVAACLLALAATSRKVRTHRLLTWLGAYPHPSTISAWWYLFEEQAAGDDRYVGLMLDDQSYLHGKLLSFNANAEDGPDRDLVLMAPITYRGPNMTSAKRLDCGAATVSARHIVAMTVAYVPAD